jgi:hypothetical protein
MRFHDGRFERHRWFKFLALNMLYRRMAEKQTNFYIKQYWGKGSVPTVGEMQERLKQGDTTENSLSLVLFITLPTCVVLALTGHQKGERSWP